MAYFILPSSVSVLRQDRFDLVGSEDTEIPFWDILSAILNETLTSVVDVNSLIQTLDTISVSLRGKSMADYNVLIGFLQEYFNESPAKRARFFETTWPRLVSLAMELPLPFSDGIIPTLGEDGLSTIVLTRAQTACLVVHQFLCSLPPQPWATESFVDLSPWYSSSMGPIQTRPVLAYLTALFTYFERIAEPDGTGGNGILMYTLDDWPIIYKLCSVSTGHMNDIVEISKTKPLNKLAVTHLAHPSILPEHLGLPGGACVISANRCFGYGPTGTQEELHVGTTPEAYPAVLFAQPLADDQVLVCRGAEPMVSIRGYGRDARLDQILCGSAVLNWRERVMLFMDALELDLVPREDGLIPDLLPSNCLRELIKLYTGFSSGSCSVSQSRETHDTPTVTGYNFITTGMWGCRTFGGNREIKTILQWCAASLGGIPVLQFICAGPDQADFAVKLRAFISGVETLGGGQPSWWRLFELLTELEEQFKHDGRCSVQPDGVFDYVTRRLQVENRRFVHA